ncbi:MAG: transglutaminase domain-containing protein, partial [Planctomycetes bacterium]|nr:transglutaminase domain-containing protein [Planctomycetota bacterium]
FRTWFRGTEVGHQHNLTREVSGNTVTVIKNQMTFSIRGKTFELRSAYQYVELPDGQPLSFNYQGQRAMAGNINSEGVIKNNKLHLKIKTRQGVREEIVDCPETLKFPHAIEKLYQVNNRHPETKFSYHQFVPSISKIVGVTVKMTGKEKVKTMDQELDLNKYLIISNGDTTFEWRDEQGKLFKTREPRMDLVNILVDKDTALASARPDIWRFMQVASIDTRLPRARQINSALFKLEFPDKKLLAGIPWEIDNRQKIKYDKNGGFLLRISKINLPEKRKILSRPVTDKSMSDYLTSNKYLESDDPEIISLARKIVGDEKDSLKAATKLGLWVSRNMKKGDNPGFETAKKALQDLTGDCSEHAVLVAALARAAGIPSKTSFGIVYDKGGFFVHMWAQVYVGQWVTIDATITNPHAQINVGPTHIALNTSSLKDVNNLSELMKAADKFNGQLKLKLIEYELDGQTKKPAKNP